MPDTIRTLGTLQDLLRDNQSSYISAQAIRDFLVSVDPENVNTLTNFASRALSQKSGLIQRYYDSPMLGRDNQNGFDFWGPIYYLTNPNLLSWSWNNQGTATSDTTKGGIIISTSDAQIRGLEHNIPTAPYTATAIFLPLFYSSNFQLVGMYLRNSTSGNLVVMGVGEGGHVKTEKWTNPSTFNAAYSDIIHYSLLGNPRIFRIKDNNTTRFLQASVDGNNFITLFSTTRTDFTTPDKIGFFAYSNTTNPPAIINLLSWKETQP